MYGAQGSKAVFAVALKNMKKYILLWEVNQSILKYGDKNIWKISFIGELRK